ncbi:double-strand break repair helicase AddA [Futiania mangrovi]|uniref:DNA 3'-5' helicase n=1 Tax=Futiania mangrovi TaxID=2959716 RepID=A0A9J6PHD3_9PROT|nr:double-strand break repair helicase AddA [Futiania mangrovii]MCP1337224.1 double-strand break repair helicase AddA [Futiania mangrovii]
MTLTPEFRESVRAPQRAAAAPDASVWVSANAGSGKTRVLVDRVARLLLAGTPPARLLCLTFTKAAASEMATRLFRTLGGWATMPDAQLHEALEELTGEAADADRLRDARRLFARALETPGGLKIQTIHAFCESLLKRFPLEAGLSPHFEVADEGTAKALLGEAFDGVLSHLDAAQRGEIAAAVDRLSEVCTHETLLGHVRTLQTLWRRHGTGERDAEAELAALAATLGIAPGTTADQARAEYAAESGRHGWQEALEKLSQEKGKEAPPRAVRLLAALRGNEPGAREAAYRDFALTQKGEARKKIVPKGLLKADPAAADTLEAIQDWVVATDARVRAARQLEAMDAILTVAHAVDDRYRIAKRARALLDYDDLIDAARDLLVHGRMTPWVLFKLDGGIDHVLVDEAQDTAPEQWQIVGALTEEFFAGEGARPVARTLFAVGDEKQSIYSFQGADPGAVAATRETFRGAARAGGARWAEPRLDTSFRTVPAVLHAVDAVFADPAARDGLVFDGDDAIAHRAYREGEPGSVELWPLLASDVEDKPDAWWTEVDRPSPASGRLRLARLIAEQVTGWLSGLAPRRIEALQRDARPGDILILVRKRDALARALARELKTLGVPVAGTDRMMLTEQISVMDLLAVAEVALLPENDLALATALKTPLCGLSDDHLIALAPKRTGTLWHALETAAAAPDAAPGIAAAHGLLARARARADFTAPFEFFSWLLEAEGGRTRLAARLGPEIHDPVDELLAQALDFERTGTPALQAFLHWIRRSAHEVKREMEQQADAVRIMTVHGAKGLEANIVILPDTTAKPSDGSKTSGLFHDADLNATVWGLGKDSDADAVAEARGRREKEIAREERRLLYVALTRARDQLIVAGALGGKPKEGAEPEAPEGSWYALVTDGLARLGAQETAVPGIERPVLHYATDGGVRTQAAADTAARTPAPAPAWLWQPPREEPRPTRPLSPSAALGEEPGPGAVDPERARLARRRGTLIHRLLETLPELPVADRAAAGRRYLDTAARDLDEDVRGALLEEALGVLATEGLAPLFAPGSRAEVPLAGVLADLGGRVVSGTVDRLAVTDTQVIVADYKTNRPPPADVKDVPDAYAAQMAVYRAALREIYPGREIACWLVWTWEARAMRLADGVLDAALARLAPGTHPLA